MKLNFGKRLVLFLHWLLSVVFVVAIVVFGGIDLLKTKLASLVGDIDRYILIAYSAIYVLLAIGTVIIVLHNDVKRADRGFITMDSSDNGKVRIAISAIESMVRQAVCNVEGINDMKIAVNGKDDSIEVRVNVVVVNGTHVPTVTLNMQRAIRQFVEMNCGVTVSNVSISVSSVANTPDTPVMKLDNEKPVLVPDPIHKEIEPEAETAVAPAEEEPVVGSIESDAEEAPETTEE